MRTHAAVSIWTCNNDMRRDATYGWHSRLSGVRTGVRCSDTAEKFSIKRKLSGE